MATIKCLISVYLHEQNKSKCMLRHCLNPLKAGVADLQQLKPNNLITPHTYFMKFFLLRSTTAGLGCALATKSLI